MDRDIYKLLTDIQRTVSEISKRQVEMERHSKGNTKTFLEVKNLLRGIDRTTETINKATKDSTKRSG
jgi:hypothetical protein